jgi:hypothetical protein
MGMATPRVGLGGQRRQLAAADRQLLTQINSPTFEELQGSGFLAEGRWGGYSNIGREEINVSRKETAVSPPSPARRKERQEDKPQWGKAAGRAGPSVTCRPVPLPRR